MKKFIHALVLAVFAYGCMFTLGILKLAPAVARANPALPGFTRLCIAMQPVVLALPILAAAYFLWVLLRKADRVPSWVGFFAATTGALVLVTIPAMVAAYLPLLSALNQLAAK